MHRRTSTGWRPGAAAVALGLVLAACGATPAAESQPATSESEAPPASEPAAEAVEIEWYVGLGTGENEEQIPAEEAVVEAFNAANPDVHLTLTVVDNTEASDTLATRIAAGDAPDIIGPIGILGCMYLFYSLPAQTQQWFLIWNLAGLVLYFVWAQGAARRSRA